MHGPPIFRSHDCGTYKVPAFERLVGESILQSTKKYTALLDTDTAPDAVSVYQYTVILYSKYHTVIGKIKPKLYFPVGL